MSKYIITETTQDILAESKGDKLVIAGVFSSASVKNKNGRIYKKEILEREVQKIMEKVKSKCCFGELGHPTRTNVDLKEAAILIEDLKWNKDDLIGKATVMNTPAGNIIKSIHDSGGRFGISSRGTGSVNENGYVNEDFDLVCWDIVSDASNPSSAFVNGLYEMTGYIEEPKIITLEEAKEEHEKRVWQVIKELSKF